MSWPVINRLIVWHIVTNRIYISLEQHHIVFCLINIIKFG